MKKLMLILAALLMMLTLSCAAAEYSGDYRYTLREDGTAEITRYFGKATELTLPAELDGHPVSAIAERAVSGKTITTVQIPDSIVHVSGNPFVCPNLAQIKVAPGHPTLAVIDGALYYLPDKQLVSYPIMYGKDSCTIPQGILSIGSNTFCGAGLTSVSIPDSVTSIGENAFCGAGLTSVHIPASVISIGEAAFYRCEHLTTVTFDENSALIELGNHTFSETPITSVDLPDKLTHIGTSTFRGCWQMTSVDLPDQLLSIGPCAFLGTSIVSVTLPDQLTIIGREAFHFCNQLTTIHLPASVTVLDEDWPDTTPFAYCHALKAITVAEENPVFEAIDGVLFNREKKILIQYPLGRTDTSYTIPDGTLTIAGWAFDSYKPVALQEIVIPASVNQIGIGAFCDPEALYDAFGCPFTFTVTRDSYANQWFKQWQLTYTFPDSSTGS